MAGKHRRGAEPDQNVADQAPEPVDEADGLDSAEQGSVDTAGGSLGLPTVSLLPASLPPAATLGAGAVVVPGHASARRAVREERRHQARRVRIAAAVAIVVLVAALAWFLTSSGGGSGPTNKAAPVGRTQQTVLLQVVDDHHTTLDAVLLAHDRSGQGTGFGALIPATLLVNAPGVGSVALAQASTTGGPAVGAGAVADAIGVTVDGGWQLSTTGLASLVDAVGGVDVTVDEDINQTTPAGGSVLLVPAGQRHLGGQLAATYATFLDAGAPEQQRLARLSTVLQALLAKLPAGERPLAALVTPLLGATDASMSADRVTALLGLLRGDAVGGRLSFDNVPTHPLDVGGAAPALVVDNNALAAFVKADFAASTPTNAAGAPFGVLVQNGVGTPGLDEKARRRLAGAGISYVNGANASSFQNPTSTVLIADGSDTSQRQGAAVAKALGLPAADIKITDQGQTLAAVVVILGDDFKP
jgi:hypothetical protein